MSSSESNASPHDRVLQVGETFAGRYRVVDVVGEGGMGVVYKVHDVSVDEMVALKILAVDDDAAVECFRRELKLARRVTHKNVARTFDLGRF